MKQIHEWLASQGWKAGEWSEPHNCTGHWYRRFPEVVPACYGNDNDGVQMVLREYDQSDINTIRPIVYELELTAEPDDGVWVQFKVYTLVVSELREKLDAQVDKLIRAWKAAQKNEEWGL